MMANNNPEPDTMAEPSRSDGRRSPGRADFLTGMLLSGLGLAFALQAWRMPRLEERGINPLTAPGIVPGFLGVVLLILGLMLALRGASEDRPHIGLTTIIGTQNGPIRLGVALGLNLIFGLLLVGWLPFWLATFSYLIVFMSIFGLDAGEAGMAKRAALLLAIAAAATLGIVYLFEALFYVRLP
jgi:putative tricarboxylic transport membrane protein